MSHMHVIRSDVILGDSVVNSDDDALYVWNESVPPTFVPALKIRFMSISPSFLSLSNCICFYIRRSTVKWSEVRDFYLISHQKIFDSFKMARYCDSLSVSLIYSFLTIEYSKTNRQYLILFDIEG